MPRRAARKDANHAAIVSAMQAAGAHVIDTSRMGDGFPDVLIGAAGKWMLIEIKDGAKPASRRKLTADQVAWWDAHAHVGPCALVSDIEGAVRAVKMLRGAECKAATNPA